MKADAHTARLAAGQNGGLTHQQLVEHGLSDDQIFDRRQSGLLVDMHEGVYRHAAAPATWEGAVHAGVLACGVGSVASHRTGARLHTVSAGAWGGVEITSPATDLPLRRGLLVHRTTLLEAADVTTIRGIPVTSIARTLLDLGAVVPYEIVEHAVQDAVIRKLVTEGQLAAVLERVGGRGRRGTAPLRAVLRQSVPDARLASMLELKLSNLITQAGLPMPELQHEVVCADGRRVFLDMAWPDWRLAIEGDGHRWHGTSAQLRDDLARSRSIQASGWTHYRFGWTDVADRAPQALAELCRLSRLYAG